MKASVSAHRHLVDIAKSCTTTRDLSLQCWPLFLVVFNSKNMFLSIPSSMEENIFLVFSIPGGESWKHFSFPKKPHRFKACLQWSTPAQSSADCTSPKRPTRLAICWVRKLWEFRPRMRFPLFSLYWSNERIIKWLFDSCSSNCNRWRQLSCFFIFFFFSWPVQQKKKKMMHDKLMDGDNKRFA